MAVNSNDEAYRKEQLDFVSNTHGTSARETLLLLMPCVCSLLLMVTTTSLVGKYMNRLTKFVLEFLIVIVPTILSCTIYSDAKILVCVTLFALSCANITLIALTANLATSGSAKPLPLPTGRRPFITNFRALTSVLTAICILAVDFKVFPRRYAKTQIYGYSLMDTGVGFFVMANALVSPEARESGQEPKSSFVKAALRNFLDSVRTCIPLLVLGSARYFSIEYLDYQRQITEYGVHWNFFITLAAVKILTSTVSALISSKHSLLVGILTLAGYEYTLNQTSVRRWLVGYSRKGFIEANKEGIVSTLGYVGLYFVGVAIGRLIHSTYRRASKARPASPESNQFRLIIFEAQYSESMILCVKLSLIAAQACVATLFLDGHFRVSRKFANAGYCAWMITLSTIMLTLLLLVDVITDILRQLLTPKEANSNKKDSRKGKEGSALLSSTPEILEAVNYNGLAFFLLSNLLTGAINLSMKTLYVADVEAVKIITAYLGVGTGLFALLHRYKIQIKL